MRGFRGQFGYPLVCEFVPTEFDWPPTHTMFHFIMPLEVRADDDDDDDDATEAAAKMMENKRLILLNSLPSAQRGNSYLAD